MAIYQIFSYLFATLFTLGFLWLSPLHWGDSLLIVLLALFAYAWVNRYVKAQKEKNELIKACEERYNAFLENSQEGIWRFELKKPMDTRLPKEEQIDWILKYGYFAECNNKMAKMYGLSSPNDLVGKPLTFKISKTLLSHVYLSAFITQHYNLKNLEIQEKKDTGEVSYYLAGLYGVICNNANLVRGWGKQRDISGTKKHALERERLLKEAEEAKTIAEIANNEKDRVLANLSHELRSPLVSIVGYSEILKEETSKEELVKGLEIINREGKAQLQLIEDLLAVSKAVTGKARHNKEEFDLKGLIEEKVESFKYKYEPKKLEVKIIGDSLMVLADKLKVGQIFTNIFSNAAKFTDKGSITIRFGKCNGKAYYFSVEDTGIGISQVDIRTIFNQYYQVDKSIARKRAGIGLGLHIVKTLVNLEKGRVEAVSQLGKGSTFIVKLPTNGNDLRVLGNTLEGTHLLIAEDDTNIGNIMKILFEREGTSVTWVTSAKDAREVLKEDKFELYLFDVAMPEEDGISLMKDLRQSGDSTPAVAISAYSNFEKPSLGAGFNLFLLKPLTLDKLKEIKSLLV